MSELEDRLEDLVSVGEAIAKGLKKQVPPRVEVNVPPQEAQKAPVINVEVPQGAPPPAPVVNVEVPERDSPSPRGGLIIEIVERDSQGFMKKMKVTPQP